MAQLKEQDIFARDVEYPWEFRKDHQAKAEREAPITGKIGVAGPTDWWSKIRSFKKQGTKEETATQEEKATKEEKSTKEEKAGKKERATKEETALKGEQSTKEEGTKEPGAEDSKGKNIERQDVGASKPPDPIKPAPKSVPTPEGASGEPTVGDSKVGESKARGSTTEMVKAPIIKPLKTAPVGQQNEVGPKAAGPDGLGMDVLEAVEILSKLVETLKTALVGEQNEVGPKAAGPNSLKMDDLEAMKILSKLFETMQRECEAGITELEKETTEMIGLVSNFLRRWKIYNS